MGVRTARVEGTRRLLVDRVVDVPAETVWELLIDTDRWPEWGPSVERVESTDRYVETGTTGRVVTPVGVAVPFEVTTCEPYVWRWTVAEIPATGHRVDPMDGDRCQVAFEVPPLAAGYVPVCRRALDRIATATRTE